MMSLSAVRVIALNGADGGMTKLKRARLTLT
jgi:hypothetical protein